MFVILSYDIETRRVSKVMKICRKYLNHVQKSVFEGEITEKKLESLKFALSKAIVPENDHVCIYKCSSVKNIIKQQIGKTPENSHIM